jgi:hypothetical protein
MPLKLETAVQKEVGPSHEPGWPFSKVETGESMKQMLAGPPSGQCFRPHHQ